MKHIIKLFLYLLAAFGITAALAPQTVFAYDLRKRRKCRIHTDKFPCTYELLKPWNKELWRFSSINSNMRLLS